MGNTERDKTKEGQPRIAFSRRAVSPGAVHEAGPPPMATLLPGKDKDKDGCSKAACEHLGLQAEETEDSSSSFPEHPSQSELPNHLIEDDPIQEKIRNNSKKGDLVPMPPGIESYIYDASSSSLPARVCAVTCSSQTTSKAKDGKQEECECDCQAQEQQEQPPQQDLESALAPPTLQRQGHNTRNRTIASRPGAWAAPPIPMGEIDELILQRISETNQSMSDLSLASNDTFRGSLVTPSKEFRLSMTTPARCSSIMLSNEEALDVQPFPETIEEGDKEDESSKRKCTETRFFIFLRILIIVWLVAFVMGLLFRIDPKIQQRRDYYRRKPAYASKKKNQTTSSSNAVIYPPFNGSETLLKPSTLKLIQDNQDSPQYHANAWMAQDPHLHNCTDDQKLQRFGLVTQYYALDGDNWFHKDHWLSYNVSECYWYTTSSSSNNSTFTIIPPSSCNEQGQIIYQDLSSNNLQGRTPKEAQLPSLLRVDQSNNGLSGRLPFFSSTIQELVFSHNNFEGPLVVDGGMASAQNNLRVFKLDSNKFAGFIHKGFSLFPKLQILNLTNNQFEGTVPEEVQYLPSLTYFGLGHNLYEGTIPTHFGLLTQLRELDLSGNAQMEGTLPLEMGALSLLERMDLRDTNLSGALPPDLCSRQARGDLELLANCTRIHCCT